MNKVKSQEVRNTEAGRELQSLPEEGRNNRENWLTLALESWLRDGLIFSYLCLFVDLTKGTFNPSLPQPQTVTFT